MERRRNRAPSDVLLERRSRVGNGLAAHGIVRTGARRSAESGGGWDPDLAGGTPDYDPSSMGISGVYVGALHDYLTREPEYRSQQLYLLSEPGINLTWNTKHKASVSREEQDVPDTAVDVSNAMRKNPKLKVFSANGDFGPATPFS